MRTWIIGLAALPLTVMAQRPESLCELDGTPVAECVRLLKQAAEESDEGKREDLKRQANEAYTAARAAKDARPATYQLLPSDATLPPLDAYRSAVGYALLSCKLSFDLARSEAQLGKKRSDSADYPGCIRAHRDRAIGMLNRALPTLKKKPAQAALKDVHVAFVTALEGVAPKDGEVRIAYSTRQSALADRVTAAWARFDIER